LAVSEHGKVAGGAACIARRIDDDNTHIIDRAIKELARFVVLTNFGAVEESPRIVAYHGTIIIVRVLIDAKELRLTGQPLSGEAHQLRFGQETRVGPRIGNHNGGDRLRVILVGLCFEDGIVAQFNTPIDFGAGGWFGKTWLSH
jgi:hypothetical protein